jgi:hypothetical protein
MGSRRVEVFGTTVRLVASEGFVQDENKRVPIRHKWVKAPDELMYVICHPDDREAHERDLRRIRDAASLSRLIFKLRSLSLRLGQRRPVQLLNGYRQAAMDDLMGFIDALPGERSAQDRVSVNHLLPGSLKRRNIHPPMHNATQLGAGGHPTSSAVACNEEQFRLNRRNRVESLDISYIHFKSPLCLDEMNAARLRESPLSRTAFPTRFLCADTR